MEEEMAFAYCIVHMLKHQHRQDQLGSQLHMARQHTTLS
jgi:hypothetical protein